MVPSHASSRDFTRFAALSPSPMSMQFSAVDDLGGARRNLSLHAPGGPGR
jgi:hypothetical protein